jgi:Cu-processing system permease protein
MRLLATIAANEIRAGLRNRWVAAAIVLFGGLSLLLTMLGSAPVGTVKDGSLAVVVASLASLSVYLVPLIALMLSHDAVAGEAERGTLMLLLTYPITRWQLLAGKFLGYLAILSLALVFGFGLAGLVMAVGPGTDTVDIAALMRLIASSVILGAVFIALGVLISVRARERATAVGMAIGLWLIMVVLYDLALIGLLLADTQHTIGSTGLAAAMLLNPADAFRIYNLEQLGAAGDVAGLGPAAAGLPPVAMLASIVGWMMLAGALAFAVFQRYEP